MTKEKKEKLLLQARALYAEGVAKRAIARALAIDRSTVARWAREDAEAGQPWRCELGFTIDRPGMALADRLYAKIERRLERLTETSQEGADDKRLEDRMLKLCRVLELLRLDRDDVTPRLKAMKHFAGFCVQTLSEQEMSAVRRAVRLYVDELRRRSMGDDYLPPEEDR